jgi:DNA processing protein
MAHHYRSVGPHRLLKQGAKLVESAEDVLEEIRPLIRPSWTPAPEAKKGFSSTQEVSSEEAVLLQSLDQHPRHIDEICRALQWPVSQVMSILLALELKGAVQQLPGKYFIYKG